MRCDLCFKPDTTWLYATRRRGRQVAWVRPGDAWALCSGCAALVEREAFVPLLIRVACGLEDRVGEEGDDRQKMLMFLPRMIAQFNAARTGERKLLVVA